MSQKLNWGYNDYMSMHIREFMHWVEVFAKDLDKQRKAHEKQMKEARRKHR